MTEWQFVAELLLLADTLVVLWYFSAFLQQQSASLIDVKHKLSVTTTTLFEMKKTAGTSLSKLLSATADQYDGFTLSRSEVDVQVNIFYFLRATFISGARFELTIVYQGVPRADPRYDGMVVMKIRASLTNLYVG